MRALVHDKITTIQEVSLPEPSDTEVLIKVLMAGICRTDIYVSTGIISISKPTILGHEFCGIIEENKGIFQKGDLVTVNPLLEEQAFLGIDVNGCFCEYVKVPFSHVFLWNTQNYKLGAYIEPISSGLSILNANLDKKEKIYIYGHNRISKLIQIILETKGFYTEIVYPNTLDPNYCGTIIETMIEESSIEDIQKILKPKGRLILKSRFPNKVSVNLYNFVKKEIIIQACYYYDFKKSIDFAIENETLFDPLFGPDFPLDKYEQAFTEESQTEKKVFFKFYR